LEKNLVFSSAATEPLLSAESVYFLRQRQKRQQKGSIYSVHCYRLSGDFGYGIDYGSTKWGRAMSLSENMLGLQKAIADIDAFFIAFIGC